MAEKSTEFSAIAGMHRVKEAGAKLLLIGMLVCSFGFVPETDETIEYTIKAAFIYKFTNYIEWNAPTTGDEFVIGIVGNSPIKDQLDEIARTKTVNAKKITIRQYNRPEEIGACHILFIPEKSPVNIYEILSRTNGKAILTISERDGYAAKGTDINFIQVDNKLKFEANPKAISAGGLKASSQLLKLAIIVE